MNKRGFTLVELLGVIVILSIIMLIAIPNVTSVLEKSKRSTYLADAKKLISQVEYEISNNNIEKPNSAEILRIRLSYVGTSDVSKDPDGNPYDKNNSYVIVIRKDNYLEYYVNLVTIVNGKNNGIRLVNKAELSKENNLTLIQRDFTSPTTTEIQQITGVSGTIRDY